MEEKLANIKTILSLTKETESKTMQKLKNLITENFLNYSAEKSKIYKEHDIDKSNRFNIFESISDKWYRENFHSDILFTILNPKTTEIGTKYFVQEFVRFLGIEDSFDCNSDFEVIKEQPTGIISWTDITASTEKKKATLIC